MIIHSTDHNRWCKVLESKWYENMFKIYSDIIKYSNQFYDQRNFSIAALPITTTSISSPMGLGSDSLPVKINLLGQETYLADSMQFLLEYTLRFNQNGVYYIMPSFRGEDSDERHLSQFYHSEVEIKGGLDDIIRLAEEYIQYITSFIIEKDYYHSLNVPVDHFNDIKRIIYLGHFPRIHFKDAIDLLKNEYPAGIEIRDGLKTINSEGEQHLIKKYNGVVWLTHLEHKSVPFYQQYDPDDQKYALAADLLIGMGETLGCGERADYHSVQKSLMDHQVSPDHYEWYINMKKQYPLQTSGFGMGIERYIAWLTGNYDIRNIPVVYRDKDVKIEP
ncbi:asparagine synthetase A [Bacillus sp. WMMC1349]|uniref:asparagine synthetase A n=1 Tax=Bacillus sp. WMMC1349 TaxID=2736254 RepID=UPI00281582A1|nr:asparagine synthetase A [Bacillus sp. WMMC1349]